MFFGGVAAGVGLRVEKRAAPTFARRMGGWCARIAAALAAGLVLSWMSAAAEVLWVRYWSQQGPSVFRPEAAGEYADWLWPAPEAWGAPEASTVGHVASMPWRIRWCSREFVTMVNGSLRSGPAQVHVAAGWPWKGWAIRLEYDQARGERAAPAKFFGARVLGAPGAFVVWLPDPPKGKSAPEWFPLELGGWRGAALVAFWSGAAVTVWRGPGAARRWRRRRRGLCVECGYPIGDLTKCPECGEDHDVR